MPLSQLGPVVFVSYRQDTDGDGSITEQDASDLYAINPDGSGLRQLTDDAAMDLYPRWSPDGTSIAFSSDRDGDFDIYVMNSDGSGVRQLTDDPNTDTMPTWSPDSTQLAFVSDREGSEDIYLMNVDGTGQSPITYLCASELEPEWSPDGKKIVFVSYSWHSRPLEVRFWAGQILIADLERHQLYPVTPYNEPASFSAPRWSPDGRFLAYVFEFALEDDSPPMIMVNWIGGDEPEQYKFALGHVRNRIDDGRRGYSWSSDSKRMVVSHHLSARAELGFYELIGPDGRFIPRPGSSLDDVVITDGALNIQPDWVSLSE